MSTSNTQGNDPFFRPIGHHVEDDQEGQEQLGHDGQPHKMVEEIESLCMRCEQNGVTRLLMTYIPYFKEVLVASFLCDHCGERNNEIQSAGEIQEKGCIYTVHINNATDLNRQVVKSGTCTVNIPELAIEIPPKRGQLTTIEGLVSDTLRDLELDQPLRKHMQPEAYEKIEVLCNKLRDILGEDRSDLVKSAGEEAETQAQEDAAGNSAQALAAEAAGIKSHGPVGGSNARQEDRTFPPFSIRLDDPSGNSFVEFLGTIQGRGVSDAKWTKRDYPRTRAQNEMLGLAGPADPNAKAVSSKKVASLEEAAAAASSSTGGGFSKGDGETDFENEEIYTFPGACSSCNAPLDTLMKKVNIPYFKDVIIMSTNCDFCGYRDNEVKSGTAISERGRKLTLKVEDAEDLTRDILKSESAGFSIPEIDLNLSPGTLGGRFTTLEGLLQQVYDELSERVLMRGDSSSNSTAFEGFLGKLKAVMSGEACPFTVILDDPLASSYLQNPYAPDADEQLTIEDYDRTWDQNEDLGLNDINVEEYKGDDDDAGAGAGAGAEAEAAAAAAKRKADGAAEGEGRPAPVPAPAAVSEAGVAAEMEEGQ